MTNDPNETTKLTDLEPIVDPKGGEKKETVKPSTTPQEPYLKVVLSDILISS